MNFFGFAINNFFAIMMKLFAFLFIFYAMLITQQKPKEGNVIEKAEYIITMEWDDNSMSDIDLWVSDPKGGIVFFGRKSINFLNLDRDDLGGSTDTVDVDGEKKIIPINREVVTIRGIIKGEYIVNAFVYRVSERDSEHKIKVKVVRLNPYKEIYSGTEILHSLGEERTLVRFSIDENGNPMHVVTEPQFSLTRKYLSQ